MAYQSYHDVMTRPSVLAAVTDPANAVAWSRFFDLYAGFVFAIARNRGLSVEDSDDVVQAVFSDLARRMPTFNYDRKKGRFRSYLLELINWRVIDKLKSCKRETDFKVVCRKKMKIAAMSGIGSSIVDREWRATALKKALRRLKPEVRPDHFAAFVESSVEGIDTETVMRLHGITRDNLYQIRKRLTARLKTIAAAVLTEMDSGKRLRVGDDAGSKSPQLQSQSSQR